MDHDMDKLAQAALDTIKPRWRELPKDVKKWLLADVVAALTAVSVLEELDGADEV